MSKKKFIKTKENYNKKKLTELIFQSFNDDASRTFNYKQISKKLNIEDTSARQMVVKVLQELKNDEKIEEIYQGKYRLKVKAGYITGIVDLTTKGFAYIKTDDLPEDVFVSQVNLRQALHGDTVKVYLYAKKKNAQTEGEVVQVIERAKTSFVGVLEISKHYAFLVTDSRQMPHDIFIPFDSLKGGKNGQKAIARIVEWPKKAKNPVGEVVTILGDAGNNDTEMHAILAEFDLPYAFAPEVEKAAEKIPEIISQEEIDKRRDFRKITTFTIDPVDAKDFDDALSIKELDNGNWEIGVHIADVTFYVRPKEKVEEEAYKRATSVYLVDRVVPMLPEQLSNKVCSLRPNEDKLCYSAVFEINEKAEVLNEWFGRTIINSDRRFTYEEAQEILDSENGDLAEELAIFNRLAKLLRAARFKKGAIGFERSEVRFKIDEAGKPLSVYTKEMHDSNKLIEEFMLLANRKVAEKIGKPLDKKTAKTFVYRIHDRPDQEKLMAFSNFIKRFGYKIKLTSASVISQSLNNLLDEVHGKKEQNVIEQLAVRSMAKAIYSTKNIGHYGLAFTHYSHFTSPIRRYPDMMVHRLLDMYLKGEKSVDADAYELMCKHSSNMEQRAAEAERASIKYKQVEFMSDKIGRIYKGVISGVKDWGIYVEILENNCEGLVPVRDMTDDFYIFDEDNFCLRGKYSKKQFGLGDEIQVEVMKANLQKKQLTFKIFDDSYMK